MVLPKSFRLAGKRWTVEYTTERLYHRGQKCRGLCHPGRRHLQVWLGQSPRLILSTFIHEYCHAVENELGLKIPHALIFALEGPLAGIVLKAIAGA